MVNFIDSNATNRQIFISFYFRQIASDWNADFLFETYMLPTCRKHQLSIIINFHTSSIVTSAQDQLRRTEVWLQVYYVAIVCQKNYKTIKSWLNNVDCMSIAKTKCNKRHTKHSINLLESQVFFWSLNIYSYLFLPVIFA